ncbi:hypothetical protein H2200_000522 [Cladophialophora chaetospira]|uniref:Uncharacterized protein n=1 Tax=Cladophialophora chaetospira TaxID=386627 RepID=A0AA38XNL7_9EURO|nr:hypothetical protein H2200_000522 [Cladophialophora chaetospira]
MIIPFKKKKSGDASSLASSQDSIAEAKARIAKDIDDPGLQVSMKVSSMVHSIEQGCRSVTLVLHNPTKRYIAVLRNSITYDKIRVNKSTFYHDIEADVVDREPRYQVNVRCLTLDMGWLGWWGWWSMFKDWKRNPQVTNLAPGETRKVYMSSGCKEASPHVEYTAKERGLFQPKIYLAKPQNDLTDEKWKSYIAKPQKDFTNEQWKDPKCREDIEALTS